MVPGSAGLGHRIGTPEADANRVSRMRQIGIVRSVNAYDCALKGGSRSLQPEKAGIRKFIDESDRI